VPADPVAERPPETPDPGSPEPRWAVGSIEAVVIHQADDPIVVTDLASRILVWNPAAERLYGIASGEAIGQLLPDLVESVNERGEPIDRTAARASLEADGVWRQRIHHRLKVGLLAGRSVVIDITVSVLRDPAGAPAGAVSVHRDVTATTRLESELAALGSLVIATGRARSRAEVAQAALELLCRATDAEAGLVTSTVGGYEATAHIGVNQATIDAILSFGQLAGPLAQALAAPDSVVSADVATAPLREDVRTAVMANGIEHLLVVGLRLSGRLTGILALGWRQRAPREPSPAIIQQAAALVAAAMENARLITAVESGLSEERLLTRRMRALVELTRLPETAVSSDLGVEPLMREVQSVIEADGSIFALVGEDRLTLVAVEGVDQAQAEPLVNRPLAELPFMAGLRRSSGALLFPLGGPLATVEGTASGTSHGYRSIVAFAVRDDGVLHGVLLGLFRRPVAELEIDARTLEAIGRVLDISFANRRLREGVASSERRYRDLFEASPDALLVEGPRDVVDANRAARSLFGAGIVGRPVDDLYVADRTIIDRETLGPEGISGLTGTGRRLDGSTFPEEVDLRPIEIAGERRMLAIVRDLTERTRMQAELVQAQKMDAIGMLVAGVAHELNNPLAAIVGFSHLLRTDPSLPPDLRSQADLLVQEANRTRVIVQNLLDFARLRPPERVELELGPLLDSVLGLQSYVLARNRLNVVVELEPDLPRLSVDRSQMQQVLINLTVNASQAIHDAERPGTIRIRARAGHDDDGPTVRIEIADDGPGVPPAILDRLFMPFVTTKEPGAGTGLGLSVSFGIVRSHGGTLRHEPNPGGGAVFIVELPAVRSASDRTLEPGSGSAVPARVADAATAADVVAEGERPRTPADAPAAVGMGSSESGDSGDGAPRRLRILVLDDEPSIRDLLGRVIKRNGQEPILTDTGSAALEIVRRDPPDAILCDHRMAGMSGTEFLLAVMDIAPDLARRFAFMSGDVLNPELREFAEARGIHLLAKPFDMASVGSVVATLLAADRL
jgi:PAS domain S-box-containing protein